MATCVDLAGATYPSTFKGHAITPLEGVSLRPAFNGQPLARTQPLFWEHEGNRAVRSGPWKLVAKHPGDWELYNLDQDRSEQTNLAQQQPARVKELSALYEAWAKRVGALPWSRVNPANGKGGKKAISSGE